MEENENNNNSEVMQQITDDVDSDRATEYRMKFEKSTSNFEAKCMTMVHKKCNACQIVSLQEIFQSDTCCKSCYGSSAWTKNFADMLPVWINDDEQTQLHVPDELSCLREGERLLIQQISVYVPLHHLMYGQLGAKGHIVSFPQDISDVCKELPRLPNNVSFIRVIKYFKIDDGELSSLSFSIRREKVLRALYWLKKYNVQYEDINIVEENLDWIENQEEQQLTPTILKTSASNVITPNDEEDRGPSEEQIAIVTDGSDIIEPCYGTVAAFNPHVPKEKDSPFIEGINEAEIVGKETARLQKRPVIQFPYVSSDPVCEYSERHLFEKAFPCLFPGGSGGYGSIRGEKPDLKMWMTKMMLYKDGRFARDKMWAFCALNFTSRHINQNSGGFFVQTFFKQGPKTLEELKEQVASKDMSWLNSICYFSQRVTGSSAYWRARREEVFGWINYHLQEKHGPPSFFITLSCAEYHWKDIERLITDRCEKGGLTIPDFKKNKVAIVNEYTIVVQEYFQKRVQIWLDTVGKDLFKIKHHWLRYEFAPSRGQIHVHMLAICDNLEMLQKCSELHDNKEELSQYLSGWMEDTMGMTAMFNPQRLDEDNETHPSTVMFCDVGPSENDHDTASCQKRFQTHKCSAYCMRKRTLTDSKESAESKLRRVCRCGAGVEEQYMKCNTPGFALREKADIVRDIRGFDRVDLPRNNRRITQSSKYLMQGWRGNCDIQLLIYKSPPQNIDAGDVSRVTNYVVSYACKGSESATDEKKGMKAIIELAQEEYGDDRDVKRMARRLLNECTKSRVVSKQEAVCQVSGLSLFTCSEALVPTSLAGNTRLGTENQANYTFLTSYATRNAEFYHMSLNQYFHYKNNIDPSRSRRDPRLKIPIYTGAQCEPVYPVTHAYARATMMIYSAWHGAFVFKEDNEYLKQQFKAFIHDNKNCPEAVKVSYNRAKLLYKMKEPTATANDIDYDTFSVKPDQDTIDLVDLASTIYKSFDENRDTQGINYDYGIDKNWSERTVDVSFDNVAYIPVS